MSRFLHHLTKLYQEQVERYRNRPFLKAAMAACALVAVADGKVSFSQRVRIDQILETLDKLKVYDPHEGVDLFNEFVDQILASPKTGHAKAVEAVQSVAKNKDTARMLIRLCLAVSETNCKISTVEQVEIVSLCTLLGIDPSEVNLYTENLHLDANEQT
jgi:tellurite resistance protein TerB